MAATTRQTLLAITQSEYAKLNALIGSIDERTATEKREDDTSIKDITGHRAHWIYLFLGWYHDGLAGKAVAFPAPGYKWNELKRYNADLRLRQADLSWADAKAQLDAASRKLIAFIEERTDADLYGGAMKGGKNAWTPGRWAEAAGASHFRSATKAIRAMLKAAGANAKP